MDDVKILPCPFCGSPAEIERGSDHHGSWFNLGCSRHWGCVPDPDTACIGGRLFYTEIEKSEAEAIAAWNMRTPASDGRAEALLAEAVTVVTAMRGNLAKITPMSIKDKNRISDAIEMADATLARIQGDSHD